MHSHFADAIMLYIILYGPARARINLLIGMPGTRVLASSEGGKVHLAQRALVPK